MPQEYYWFRSVTTVRQTFLLLPGRKIVQRMKLRSIPTRARRTWSTKLCLKGYDITQTFQTCNMWLNCTCLCDSRIPDSTSHLRSFLKESWSYISHTTLYKGTIPWSLQRHVSSVDVCSIWTYWRRVLLRKWQSVYMVKKWLIFYRI
jgi:hypothetical protein